MAKRGRPRKKLPPVSKIKRLRKQGKPWKLIEFETGVSERTLRRRKPKVFLPPQADCKANTMLAETNPQAA